MGLYRIYLFVLNNFKFTKLFCYQLIIVPLLSSDLIDTFFGFVSQSKSYLVEFEQNFEAKIIIFIYFKATTKKNWIEGTPILKLAMVKR